jgi:hypothetical protein
VGKLLKQESTRVQLEELYPGVGTLCDWRSPLPKEHEVVLGCQSGLTLQR